MPLNTVSGDSQPIQGQHLSTPFGLSHCALDVINFASILNTREGEGTKLDPLSYTETLISLLYRLIEAAPLRKPHSASGELHDGVVHLAMLTFMTTLLPEYGRDHAHSNYPLLSDHLDKAIRDIRVTSLNTQDSRLSLLLWTLFISGVSGLKSKDHQWLLLLILETCQRLDLYDWAAVRHRLCGFPWIHTLHDAPGRCLWEDSQRRSTEFIQLT